MNRMKFQPVQKMHNFAKKICAKGLWHDDGSIPCRNMSETAFPASLQTERCWKRCFCVQSEGSGKENNVTGLFQREFINGNNVVVTKQSILTTETAFPASLQTERCWKRCFCVLSGGSGKENNVTGLFRREFINGNNVVVTEQSILTTETVFPQYSNNVYAFGFSTISRCLSIYWWTKLHHGERGSEIAWVVFSFSVV